MINHLMKYVYLILVPATVYWLAAFLIRLSKTMKIVSETSENGKKAGTQLAAAGEKASLISKSAGSWKFFLSAFAILIVLKETFKYYRSEKSLSRSFAKAMMRHRSQVAGFRF